MKQDIADLEECVDALRLAPAAQSLASEALGMTKGHLELLQKQTTNGKASTKVGAMPKFANTAGLQRSRWRSPSARRTQAPGRRPKCTRITAGVWHPCRVARIPRGTVRIRYGPFGARCNSSTPTHTWINRSSMSTGRSYPERGKQASKTSSRSASRPTPAPLA